MANPQTPGVAVVGLGAQGLVTVKNLLEQGFKVTGFERNDYLGGIWHHSAKNNVSALSSTVVNISRELACFTDFPFPLGTDSYPTAAQVVQYLNNYANEFDLHPHLRLSTTVLAIDRDESSQCWFLTIQSPKSQSSEVLPFDKLIMASGPHNKAIMPDLPGRELFKGEIIHSIAYKQPELFKGKRVLVVGASNSAADTSTSLIDIASKIYFSHRRGTLVVPRYLKDGRSLDHNLSYRNIEIKETLDRLAPRLSIKFMDKMVSRIQRKQFGTFPLEWRLDPAPSLLHQNPTVSDTLIPALIRGEIESAHAPKRVLNEHSVELEDGTVVSVDSIIFCTGYSLDYSILGKDDPTKPSSRESTVAGADVKLTETPRLYQNIFSLEHPSNLAFVGIALTIFPAFLLSDLSSMAIAQLWSHRPDTPSLPPQTEMENWYSEHLSYVSNLRSLSPHGKFVKYSLRSGPFLSWVEKTIGCEVATHLGFFSPKAWQLYWSDPKFSRLLCHGIWSPHVYRLFEPKRPGGRKRWDGAREAIERVNADVQVGLEERRRKFVTAR
jgi:dimethylaniline monooxygenase (N-oxide forming)